MLGFKFVKFEPNEYVLMYSNGKVVREGSGLSFFYFAPSTSLVMVSAGSVEVPFIFEESTADFQTITVQGQVTYRIEDPKKITKLLNYTLDGGGRRYVSEDPLRLSQRIINIVKVMTKNRIDGMQLTETLKSSEKLAGIISEDIVTNNEILSMGIQILGLAILAILPNKETVRALEAQTREDILRKADNAVYERRNAAIEQERFVKENELNTDIAIENKMLQIRETQMNAEQVVQQKQNELKESQMNFETGLEEQRKELIALSVENAKAEADAKAYELNVMMKSIDGIEPGVIQALASIGMSPDKLIAMAFQGLAEKAERIGQLNITPDLLQDLLKRTD
jgi:regulator of protease activity HflC (stomatin/prohibitin superfamily)